MRPTRQQTAKPLSFYLSQSVAHAAGHASAVSPPLGQPVSKPEPCP